MARLVVPSTTAHVRRISFVPAPAGRAVRQRNYLDISIPPKRRLASILNATPCARGGFRRRAALACIRSARNGRLVCLPPRSLCWCALDEPWQPQPTPRKPRRRKPASRSHQLGDLSVDKGLPNGPGTGSQRDLPTPLRLGCLYDVDAGAQGCGGVMPRVQIKTCTAAFRRLVTSARARDKTRRHPVPLEWCSPRPLPRLAMPRLAVPRLAVPVMTWLPDTSEWKRIFVINDIPV
ncbi:hypothetical protein HPB51_024489 [Rhipicephalus microplus]|uniref:Uncharacterized protein n=1 Tax=Rhipicephalus microplus TaxID=6941 RepID=A0A9J6DE06_RHIMP|nr:hypothetical protein HPB51_024489 [Rhipicephalus microplus]